MSCACQLRFFKSIVWIDTNTHQTTEAPSLCLMFGDQIQFYKVPTDAMQCFEDNENDKFLIVCNSRIIRQVYQNLGAISNVYPKFIIFCGSSGRAKEVKEKDHYRQVVENAYWDTADLICAIIALDQQLVKQPNLMNNRVEINPPPPPPSQSQSPFQIQAQFQTQNKPQLQPHPHLPPLPIQTQMSKLNIGSGNKKVEQIKQQKPKSMTQVKQSQVKKQKKEKKKNKLADRQDVRIYWIVEQQSQIAQIRSKEEEELQGEGYYLTKIDTHDNLYYDLVNQTNTEVAHIVIAKTNVGLNKLIENDSNLKLALRLSTDSSHIRNAEERGVESVSSVEQIATTITNCI